MNRASARIRSFGRVKRIAWFTLPALTSSVRRMRGAMGRSAASAPLHPSPRPKLGAAAGSNSRTREIPDHEAASAEGSAGGHPACDARLVELIETLRLVDEQVTVVAAVATEIVAVAALDVAARGQWHRRKVAVGQRVGRLVWNERRATLASAVMTEKELSIPNLRLLSPHPAASSDGWMVATLRRRWPWKCPGRKPTKPETYTARSWTRRPGRHPAKRRV